MSSGGSSADANRPGLSVPVLNAFAHALGRIGVPREQFFSLLGLPNEADVTGWVAMQRVGSVLDVLARKRNTPHLGLDLGRAMPLGTLGATDYTWSASATLFHAMLRMDSHVAALTDGIRFELHIEDGVAQVLFRHVHGSYPAVLNETTIALLVTRIRHVLGTSPAFKAIHFSHAALGDSKPYEEFFGLKPKFQKQYDGVFFDAGLLQEPLMTSDPELVRLLRGHPRIAKKDVVDVDAFLDRARTAIATALESGEGAIDVATLAGQLQMSTRSLQRKLGERNTSFSDLLDEARHDLATKLLEQEGTLLAEVADRLGFSDLSAFHRAFRRWTGASPRAFQKLR